VFSGIYVRWQEPYTGNGKKVGSASRSKPRSSSDHVDAAVGNIRHDLSAHGTAGLVFIIPHLTPKPPKGVLTETT
jgi:hypothetical protein